MEITTILSALVAFAGFPLGMLVAYFTKEEVKNGFKFLHWAKIASIIGFLTIYLLLNDQDNFLLYLLVAGFIALFFSGAEYFAIKI